MKTLLLLIATATIACAATSDYNATKRTQLITWMEWFRTKAAEAQATTKQTLKDLAVSKTELATTQTSLANLQLNIDNLTTWGNGQRDRADKAEAQVAIEKAAKLKAQAEAHKNAVERDIILLGFSLACAILAITCYGQILGFVVRIWPAMAPWGMLIMGGIAIAVFWAVYGAARGVLAVIASKL